LPVMREAYADDYPKRERDLEHFQNLTERYKSLEQMLADMALEPPNDSLDGVLATDSEDEHLTLTTIHSAKGLEWKVVFLIWAADGRFPGPQSVGFTMGRVSRFLEDVPAELLQTATLQESEES